MAVSALYLFFTVPCVALQYVIVLIIFTYFLVDGARTDGQMTNGLLAEEID